MLCFTLLFVLDFAASLFRYFFPAVIWLTVRRGLQVVLGVHFVQQIVALHFIFRTGAFAQVGRTFFDLAGAAACSGTFFFRYELSGSMLGGLADVFANLNFGKIRRGGSFVVFAVWGCVGTWVG